MGLMRFVELRRASSEDEGVVIDERPGRHATTGSIEPE
jgi:hypothetical protein